MSEYITKQLRMIHKYAIQQNLDDETACIKWVQTGLAEQYNKTFKYLQG